MTDRTQSEAGSTHIIRYALELGLLWIDGDGRDKVREALDALDTLESQLEAQLAQRFDAADMATAAAQGFRDGVASVSAGSEPVASCAIRLLVAADLITQAGADAALRLAAKITPATADGESK